MTDSHDGPRAGLRADCARCAGLCCVVPGFAASADFAIDKPPGRPCPNLLADHRCGIHDQLAERGFPGCVTFDCFGAGQQVVQVTFGGTDPGASAGPVFEAMRPLQELRWYLVEARERLDGADGLRAEVDALDRRVADLCSAGPDVLAAVDAAAWRREGGELLGRVSAHVRAGVAAHPRSGARHAGSGVADPAPGAPDLAGQQRGGARRRSGARQAAPGAADPAPGAPDLAGRADGVGADRAGADLMGADLRRADLRGASLRGAYLIGADLRGVDLSATDLLGADMRAADLRGADLCDALFLTAPQIEAARGDAATRLPAHLARPARWTATPGSRRRRRPRPA